jgi:Rrf2 family protein
MRLLSKTCIYGIRASLFVAAMKEEKKYVPISQISKELGIPFYFLTKILQMLTRHNIMVSYRGPKGGVTLARPANQITLMDMINVIEHDSCFDGCILGLEGCGEAAPCPLHASWGETRDQIKAMFENTNLADLGRKIREDGLRLGTRGMP